MKYKKISDSEEIIRSDYSKRIIFNLDDFGNTGHLLQEVTIPPHTLQRDHHHQMQTEVFYITQGEASIYINEIEYIAKPGDSFICEPNDKHHLYNQSAHPFKLLVFKINYPQNGDEDSVWST